MKREPLYKKLKKIIMYLFNWEFINNQQKAAKLLSVMMISESADPQIAKLRQDLNRCWNLHDVTFLLSKEVSKVLRDAKVNMQIFDLKTKWFLWQDIFLIVDLVANETTKESTKRQLNTLREISSIFDLGK